MLSVFNSWWHGGIFGRYQDNPSRSGQYYIQNLKKCTLEASVPLCVNSGQTNPWVYVHYERVFCTVPGVYEDWRKLEISSPWILGFPRWTGILGCTLGSSGSSMLPWVQRQIVRKYVVMDWLVPSSLRRAYWSTNFPDPLKIINNGLGSIDNGAKKIHFCTPQGPITLGMQEIGSSKGLMKINCEPWILPRGCDENRPVSQTKANAVRCLGESSPWYVIDSMTPDTCPHRLIGQDIALSRRKCLGFKSPWGYILPK